MRRPGDRLRSDRSRLCQHNLIGVRFGLCTPITKPMRISYTRSRTLRMCAYDAHTSRIPAQHSRARSHSRNAPALVHALTHMRSHTHTSHARHTHAMSDSRLRAQVCTHAQLAQTRTRKIAKRCARASRGWLDISAVAWPTELGRLKARLAHLRYVKIAHFGDCVALVG